MKTSVRMSCAILLVRHKILWVSSSTHLVPRFASGGLCPSGRVKGVTHFGQRSLSHLGSFGEPLRLTPRLGRLKGEPGEVRPAVVRRAHRVAVGLLEELGVE